MEKHLASSTNVDFLDVDWTLLLFRHVPQVTWKFDSFIHITSNEWFENLLNLQYNNNANFLVAIKVLNYNPLPIAINRLLFDFNHFHFHFTQHSSLMSYGHNMHIEIHLKCFFHYYWLKAKRMVLIIIDVPPKRSSIDR